MRIAKDGTFSISFSNEQLTAGLRKISANPKNSPFMVQLEGMIGRDGILQALTELDSDELTTAIADGFPFPQIFVLSNRILVCGQTQVYELTPGAPPTLALKVTVAAGNTWRLVDFVDYIFMSNGNAAVTRSASTGVYTDITGLGTLPTFTAICNYNEQVFLDISAGNI